MCQNHLLPSPSPKNVLFLTNSQGLLLPQVWGLHFENHCPHTSQVIIFSFLLSTTPASLLVQGRWCSGNWPRRGPPAGSLSCGTPGSQAEGEGMRRLQIGSSKSRGRMVLGKVGTQECWGPGQVHGVSYRQAHGRCLASPGKQPLPAWEDSWLPEFFCVWVVGETLAVPRSCAQPGMLGNLRGQQPHP